MSINSRPSSLKEAGAILEKSERKRKKSQAWILIFMAALRISPKVLSRSSNCRLEML
jgi:hypothetical protein